MEVNGGIETPIYSISTIDDLEPQFVTLGDHAQTARILEIVGANNAEEALKITFPFWWESKARLEINNFRRMKDGYMFSTHGVCDLCGCRGNTVVHHIVPLDRLGGNEPENLVFVCRSCHKKAHNLLNGKHMEEYYNFCNSWQ